MVWIDKLRGRSKLSYLSTVIGAAFLIDRDAKLMPHAMLTDDLGMGKTVTTLKALAELAANAIADHSDDGGRLYLPTLILCPSTSSTLGIRNAYSTSLRS